MGRKEPGSAEIAKDRLKLVLVTDRSEVTPEKLREMQAELLDVIRRYVNIDEMELQIKIEQRDRKYYLVADIPLQREQTYVIDPPDEEKPAPALPAHGDAATDEAAPEAGPESGAGPAAAAGESGDS